MAEHNVHDVSNVDVIRALGRTGRLHRCCIDAEIDKLGFDLHRHQHIMLIHLERTGGAASQKEIAEAFGISAAAVANTLKSLERGGYVCRISDADDTRRNIVSLTAKGKDVIAKTKGALEGIDRRVTDGISPEKMKILLECVEQIESNLKRMTEKNQAEAEE